MDQRQFSATMQGFRPNKGGFGGMTPKRKARKRLKVVQKQTDPTTPRNLSFVNLSHDEIHFISSLKIDLI